MNRTEMNNNIERFNPTKILQFRNVGTLVKPHVVDSELKMAPLFGLISDERFILIFKLIFNELIQDLISIFIRINF